MKNQAEREKRMKEILAVLSKLYPNPKPALHYSNEWEFLVAVILSAQCTDKMVNKVTDKLFKKYLILEDYLNADVKEFEQDIRQTGFYRNKAKNILAAATLVKNKFNGTLPATMEAMLTIPGVARKTANVVLTEIHGKSEGIAVDTHVRRFAYRFDLSDSLNPVQIEKDLMQIVPKKDWDKITLQLIEYGREYCPARKHACREHPLTRIWPPAAERWIKAK